MGIGIEFLGKRIDYTLIDSNGSCRIINLNINIATGQSLIPSTERNLKKSMGVVPTNKLFGFL